MPGVVKVVRLVIDGTVEAKIHSDTHHRKLGALSEVFDDPRLLQKFYDEERTAAPTWEDCRKVFDDEYLSPPKAACSFADVCLTTEDFLDDEDVELI